MCVGEEADGLGFGLEPAFEAAAGEAFVVPAGELEALELGEIDEDVGDVVAELGLGVALQGGGPHRGVVGAGLDGVAHGAGVPRRVVGGGPLPVERGGQAQEHDAVAGLEREIGELDRAKRGVDRGELGGVLGFQGLLAGGLAGERADAANQHGVGAVARAGAGDEVCAHAHDAAQEADDGEERGAHGPGGLGEEASGVCAIAQAEAGRDADGAGERDNEGHEESGLGVRETGPPDDGDDDADGGEGEGPTVAGGAAKHDECGGADAGGPERGELAVPYSSRLGAERCRVRRGADEQSQRFDKAGAGVSAGEA